MTSLDLARYDIPDLTGKVVIITGVYLIDRILTALQGADGDVCTYVDLTLSIGAASGIGLATAELLASHGATVHSLDVSDPRDTATNKADISKIQHRRCDVTSWSDMLAAFNDIGTVHFAIANAGVSQECDYFLDTYTPSGELEEPAYQVLQVNLRAVLNFVKISLSRFKKQGPGGRLVLISSATAYSPEQSLPVYSAGKMALIGLVRALRSTLPHSHGATINAVAPAATLTRLLPPDLAAPIIAAGSQVSKPEHVALAIVYSLTAIQDHQVESYGRDSAEAIATRGWWNGRVILTLGSTWTEVEEPIARLRCQWLGAHNTEATAFQQRLTDFRPHVDQDKPTVNS